MAPRDRKSTRLNSSHTVIYTLSLHDALPICSFTFRMRSAARHTLAASATIAAPADRYSASRYGAKRSEEHTSELQSHSDLHSFPTRRSSDLFLHFQDEIGRAPYLGGIGHDCGAGGSILGVKVWRQ